MKVSVIMPVYNAEKYLREAIDSILEQTFRDFEFLIIDDGSTDSSVEIVNSYCDCRIKFFKNCENKGIVFSLNKGLEFANGEYIARMDADDISLRERIKVQVQFMDANKEVGVCGTWVKTFGGSKKILKNPASAEEIRCGQLFFTLIAHPTVMLRKECFTQNNLGYSPDDLYAEDYGLWVRCWNHFDIVNIPEVLLSYRVCSSNVSNRYSSIQKKTTLKIMSTLLIRLGINVSENIMRRHAKLIWLLEEYSKGELEESIEYAKSLIAANEKTAVYDEIVLRRIVRSRITVLLFHAAKRGSLTLGNLLYAKEMFQINKKELLCYFIALCFGRARSAIKTLSFR
ncbi:MAG: glycosyltransferase [Negativicutes bacterium]|jgi:glycosyltransferase involved in cell wall biosynthesis